MRLHSCLHPILRVLYSLKLYGGKTNLYVHVKPNVTNKVNQIYTKSALHIKKLITGTKKSVRVRKGKLAPCANLCAHT